MPLTHPTYNCSRWISMNVVMLDEERVIVAKGEERLIAAFKKWASRPSSASSTTSRPSAAAFTAPAWTSAEARWSRYL
jgi:hypothetical protein